MNIYPHHITKVLDAINVLKSRGDPHYSTDVVRYTSLKPNIVQGVLAEVEAAARINPTGRRTIPWTRHKGREGGLAKSPTERWEGASQRSRSIQTQLERHYHRVKSEYERQPHADKWAMQYARAAHRVGVEQYKEAAEMIQRRHLQALLDKGMDSDEAVDRNMALLEAIAKF